MKLYCVRHGEAQDASVNPERALTPQGQADVNKVAHHLKRIGISISTILHSDKLRAKQTAEIFAKTLHVPQISQCNDILDAEGPIKPILDMLPSWQDDTMLVGHLPFLFKLVSALVVNEENFFPIVNFPPSTVICLEFYENDRWIINWHLVPRLIP